MSTASYNLKQLTHFRPMWRFYNPSTNSKPDTINFDRLEACNFDSFKNEDLDLTRSSYITDAFLYETRYSKWTK